jgi:hypothetical protein
MVVIWGRGTGEATSRVSGSVKSGRLGQGVGVEVVLVIS